METIAKKSRLWFPAWMAAARYVAYNALLAYHTWHIAMKSMALQLVLLILVGLDTGF